MHAKTVNGDDMTTSNKTKGSDSERRILEHAHRGLQLITEYKPKLMGEAINRIAGVSWVDLGNEQHKMGIRQPNSTNAVYQYLEDGIPPAGRVQPQCLYRLPLARCRKLSDWFA